MSIYLARHGQNVDNAKGILNGHRDYPLTETGIKQARELAHGIKQSGLVFGAVYSSPLSRAHATGKIVCNRLEINPPVVLPDLIERNFGVMTGKMTGEIEILCAPNIIKTETITYFLSPEGAETFPQLMDRALKVLTFIRTKHSEDENTLLVGHGDFGKMLYASFYGLYWEEVLTGFHFGNGELLELREGADPKVPHVIKIEQFNH